MKLITLTKVEKQFLNKFDRLVYPSPEIEEEFQEYSESNPKLFNITLIDAQSYLNFVDAIDFIRAIFYADKIKRRIQNEKQDKFR